MDMSSENKRRVHLPLADHQKTLEEDLWQFRNSDRQLLPPSLRRKLLIIVSQLALEILKNDEVAALRITGNLIDDIAKHIDSYKSPNVRAKAWLQQILNQLCNVSDSTIIAEFKHTAETCPYQLGRSKCDSVNSLLDSNNQIDSCAKCNISNVVIKLASELNGGKNLEILDKLNIPLAFVNSLEKTNGLNTEPFYCNVLDTNVVTTCNLSSCVYHVNYPWAKNCALIYSAKHGDEKLKNVEVAMLLELPLTYVNLTIEHTLVEMRRSSLKQAYDDGSLEQEFQQLLHTNVCACCESITKTPVIVEGIVYCSKACAIEKSPPYVRIEHMFGVGYRTVLSEAINRFGSREEAYKVLGLADIANGISLGTEDTSNLRRRTGVRPTWLTELEKRVHKKIAKISG
jgi:hypothetical protein